MNNDHPKINFGKTGVLLVNLGTPDSTKWIDIRKYLKEFLSDRRVIEVNPFLWQIILNLFILKFTRPFLPPFFRLIAPARWAKQRITKSPNLRFSDKANY